MRWPTRRRTPASPSRSSAAWSAAWSAAVGLRDVRDVRDRGPARPRRSTPTSKPCAPMLAGRRVLVTGAGGSIGSEIARQVAACGPASSSPSTTTRPTCTTWRPRSGRDARSQVLADIRDAAAVQRVFERHRPEVVFHAAAHKHVPLLEDHPSEAVRTNVIGTRNLLDAAARAGVSSGSCSSPPTRRSSRRASWARPSGWASSSSLGAATRRARTHAPSGSATCWAAAAASSRRSCARSPTGGPVTVTDARMTRYFMSIEEAVQLVLQAAALARRRRGLHARHGRAGADPRPRRADDPAAGPAGRGRHRDPASPACAPARSSTRSCSPVGGATAPPPTRRSPGSASTPSDAALVARRWPRSRTLATELPRRRRPRRRCSQLAHAALARLDRRPIDRRP